MSRIKAVIFDLDGVIVSTDEYHFRAWKKLATEEGIPFSGRTTNGCAGSAAWSRSTSSSRRRPAPIHRGGEDGEMAERKNDYYRDSLRDVVARRYPARRAGRPAAAQGREVKVAIGSSSRNAVPHPAGHRPGGAFDAIVDGTHIARSKPDPEVFTKAGHRLGIEPARCLVVEDAEAGVVAGVAAGMPVLAVGSACSHPAATLRAPDLSRITVDQMLGA
jgi:beta-phosphoglucomutase